MQQVQHTGWMKQQVEDKLKVLHRIHLALYDHQTALFASACRSLAHNVALFYLISLVCMDRQVLSNENAKLKMAQEMTMFEFAVGATLFPLDKLPYGHVSKELKHYRSLLFDTSNAVVQFEDVLLTVLYRANASLSSSSTEWILFLYSHWQGNRVAIKQALQDKLKSVAQEEWQTWLEKI